MADQELLERVSAKASNRRSFVKKLGLASAALGVAGTQVSKGQSTSTAPTDIDILNFALNLEYLEAEFYTVATTGQTIDTLGITVTGSGTAGSVTGGAKVPFGSADATAYAIALELAKDEQEHVILLQQTITSLGGAPIARPAINLNALGIGFASVQEFLAVGRVFEDLGVSAYGGAAPLLASTTVLGDAARILATEAEHVGALRLLVDQYAIPTAPVDGADIVPPPSGTQFFSNNSQGLTEVRTPGQVLFVAFGGVANATSGGFFPSGINGSNSSLGVSAASAATYDGVTFSACPNPVPITAGQGGVTTLTWNAPASSIIQIRLGSPTGPLFTDNVASGSMTTGQWVSNGMQFYLQDVSNGQALTPAYTLAVLTVTTTTAGSTQSCPTSSTSGSGSSGSTGSGSTGSGSTGSGSTGSGSTGSGSTGSTGGSTGSGSGGTSTGTGSGTGM